MIIDTASLADEDSIGSDVVIVGSGAVGLTMAVTLARAGRRVTLLEAGAASLDAASQRFFENAASVGARHDGLHLGRFRMLGGTTNFWGGQLVRFGDHLFRQRDWVHPASGWPIGPNEVEPFYSELLHLLGMGKCLIRDEDVVARLHQEMPPLGSDLRYFFTRWAPQPSLAHLFEADLGGNDNLRCYVRAPAVALGLAEDGRRIAFVEVADAAGRRHRFSGRNVILANGTVEIARLLMLPAADGRATPWGGNAWLGRGFMDHVDLVAGQVDPVDSRKFHDTFENLVLDGLKYQPKICLTSEAQTANKLLDISAHMIFNSSYSEHFGNAKIFIKSFLRGRFSGSLRSMPGMIASLARVGLPMVLRYIRYRRIHSPADQGIQLRLTGEQIMVRESGIRLTDRLDALGMPTIEMDWRVDGREIDTFAYFAEAIAASLERSGLARVRIDPRLLARDPQVITGVDDANHHMGMARMAARPEDGVVDADLKVFGTDNLYVAGAAVYPSTGFPNPTFTAMALGLRLAHKLSAETPA